MAPAKVIKKFSNGRDLPHVKGILFDGKVFPGKDFKKLADLLSKDELLSKFVSQLNSPMQAAIRTKKSYAKLVSALGNLKDKKTKQ